MKIVWSWLQAFFAAGGFPDWSGGLSISGTHALPGSLECLLKYLRAGGRKGAQSADCGTGDKTASELERFSLSTERGLLSLPVPFIIQLR